MGDDTQKPQNMPLEPMPGYIVAELVEVQFFHPVTLPDGSKKAIQGAGATGTPIMRVVAVGDDVTGWAVGDYFANHPRNSDLSWNWKDRVLPLQVIKAENICAKLNKEGVEEQLRLMEEYGEPVRATGPAQPPAKAGPTRVEGPPEQKIVIPGVDLPPQL